MNHAQFWGGAAGGYEIDQSLRFNSADSAYLNRTPATAGNRNTYTISMWVKRGKLGASSRLFGSYTSANSYFEAFFTSSDTLQWYYWNGTGYSYNRNSTQVFRDVSAWYHLVFVFNSPSGTASQRMRIYVNNQEITSFSASTDPSSSFNCLWNSTSKNVIGDLLYAGSPGNTFDGYMAEIHAIDGTALTPSSFGEFDNNGVWRPIAYTGSYGTNGFYLNFADNSGTTSTTLGKDSSGNSNNWTPNGFSVTAGAGNDVMSDTPTTNWCTLNPLNRTNSATAPTDGNLTSPANVGAWRRIGATIQLPTTGKYYFEYACDSFSSFATFNIGVYQNQLAATGDPGNPATEWVYHAQLGQAINNNTAISTGFTTATTGDVLQLAYDADTGKIWFGKNNTWQGASSPDPATGTSATYSGVYNVTPLILQNWATQTANFGQRAFAYTPPTGFKALNTSNLSAPTVKDGGDHFNTVLWTGNGTSQSITGVGFQPDFLWSKARNQAYSHRLHDAVRGREQSLLSNSTGAEFTQSNSISSFDTGGFTVGSDGSHNGSGVTYVGWNWKANGSGSSNTDGTITSTVSANPDRKSTR